MRILSLKPLGSANVLPPQNGQWNVELTAPARSVMTDFTERSMVTVSESTQVDAALEIMKHARTRSAFVVDSEGRLLGFLTAYDVLGEKPMLHLQSVGCTKELCSRDDVLVRDVMEPISKWQVIDLADIEGADVRTVLDTLTKSGRTHLPVIETVAGGGTQLRGAFSASKLLRLTEQSRKRLSTAH